MTKISVKTPTEGIKVVDKASRSGLKKTISEVNKKFKPISWTRKIMPSSRIFEEKKLPQQLLIRFVEKRNLKFHFFDDSDALSIASTKTYDERKREWETVAS